MALEIVWTRQAINGFDDIIQYQLTHFTEIEVRHFVSETKALVELFRDHPEML